MTAIVGVVNGGHVYIGGDSAGVSGYTVAVRADSKVFANGPYVFGFCGSFRMGQLLRYAFVPPHPEGDVHRFMVTTFVDALRECLKQGGWGWKENEREEGGTFLVGTGGELFNVQSDYQVAQRADGYDAVGMGDELALGALHATAGMDLRPRRRMALALHAAAHFSAGVRPPFAYVSTRNRRTRALT